MSAPAILPDKRTRWLAARRSVVTASDCAAILGEDPRRGPLAVYAAKVGEFEVEETLPMRRGRRFEAAIGDEYSDQTGRRVLLVPEYELLCHPGAPWLAATLDRKTILDEAGERVPLEIKMALGSASTWKDAPPLGYQVQVQVQIACAGATWGALCGMVGPGPLKTFDLPYSQAFLEAALPRLEAFWLAVKRREPPEADSLPGTSDAIRKLWADEDGQTIPLDREALEMADALDQAKLREGAAAETVKELGNKLRARLGSASFGALPDGTYLDLNEVKKKGHTVKPTKYRVLKRRWPRLRRRMSPGERF